LSEKEQQEILPFLQSQNISDPLIRGETWEIRLAVPQTSAFEFRAVSSIPLSDSIPIPLAALPLAVTQKGEIYIESPKMFQYHVVNSRLKSIPTAPTEWYRYQEIQSAFRYDPEEEIRFSLQNSILLQRLTREEMPPSAWIWSLRLDTQYESEGIVKDNAIFLLENYGKDSLKIRLPEGINVGNVHAVWRDDQRISWQPEYENNLKENNVKENNSEDKTDKPATNNVINGQQDSLPIKPPLQNIVTIPLQEGTRFVSVSLEYSHQNIPLKDQRKLKPQYPTVDIPVLSKNWTLWFPPEFEVCLQHPVTLKTTENHSFPLPKAMNHFLTHPRFDPFSLAAWQEFCFGKSRYQNATQTSRIFFNWIATNLKKTNPTAFDFDKSLHNTAVPNEPVRTLENKTSWANLFGNEKQLLEMLGEIRRGDEKGIAVKMIIDKQSLLMLGVTPSSPVSFYATETDLTEQHGADLFKRSGLVLLVSSKVKSDKIKEYTFYVTSFLTNSLHRRFFSRTIDNCSQYIPETVNPIRVSSELSNLSDFSLRSGFSRLQWISLEEWLKDTTPLSTPWQISPSMIRLTSVMPNWNAFAIPDGTDQLFYIIHQRTFAAYYWLAFLTIIVLTTRKPFSSPVFLVFLLIVFEILTRLSIPFLIDISSGAFWGVIVSLGFGMIRSHSANKFATKKRRFPRQTHSTNKPLAEQTCSEKV
jgi:hypothetical protein